VFVFRRKVWLQIVLAEIVLLPCTIAGRGERGWGGMQLFIIFTSESDLALCVFCSVAMYIVPNYQSYFRMCHRRKEGKGLLEYWPSPPGVSAAAARCSSNQSTLTSLGWAAFATAMQSIRVGRTITWKITPTRPFSSSYTGQEAMLDHLSIRSLVSVVIGSLTPHGVMRRGKRPMLLCCRLIWVQLSLSPFLIVSLLS
jgi:hypothetical protein